MAMAIPRRSLNSPITVLAGIACRRACDWGAPLMLLLALATATKTCSNGQPAWGEGFGVGLCIELRDSNPPAGNQEPQQLQAPTPGGSLCSSVPQLKLTAAPGLGLSDDWASAAPANLVNGCTRVCLHCSCCWGCVPKSRCDRSHQQCNCSSAKQPNEWRCATGCRP